MAQCHRARKLPHNLKVLLKRRKHTQTHTQGKNWSPVLIDLQDIRSLTMNILMKILTVLCNNKKKDLHFEGWVSLLVDHWLKLFLGYYFMCVCQVASIVSDSLRPLKTVAHQAPLSMGFSRQDYWSGLPCPLPGDLPDPGIEPGSCTFPTLAGALFTTSATSEAP